MAAHLVAHGLEGRRAGLVLEHPVAGEAAVLDVFEHLLHRGLRLARHDARAGDVFAVLGRVRDRVVHVGDAAFIDQVDDQLHFVEAFEIGHLRRVAGFDQRFVAGLDQLDEAAAEHGLFAEEIRLGLFAERRLDDAGAGVADGFRVGERDSLRDARGILVDGDEARQAAALRVLVAQRVAGAFRRGERHVHVGARRIRL